MRLMLGGLVRVTGTGVEFSLMQMGNRTVAIAASLYNGAQTVWGARPTDDLLASVRSL